MHVVQTDPHLRQQNIAIKNPQCKISSTTDHKQSSTKINPRTFCRSKKYSKLQQMLALEASLMVNMHHTKVKLGPLEFNGPNNQKVIGPRLPYGYVKTQATGMLPTSPCCDLHSHTEAPH